MNDLQFGLTKGILLKKGKQVKWELTDDCMIQADGEPWKQQASSGSIIYESSVNVLVQSRDDINHQCIFYKFLINRL